ncbi:MAG: hypothetical protein V4617_10290 [Gemmatimonadota bacterium]
MHTPAFSDSLASQRRRATLMLVATGALLAACATSPRAASPPDRAPAPPAADTARRDTAVALAPAQLAPAQLAPTPAPARGN